MCHWRNTGDKENVGPFADNSQTRESRMNRERSRTLFIKEEGISRLQFSKEKVRGPEEETILLPERADSE